MRKTKDVNPPFNAPKPLPPHQHDPPGYDHRCGLCRELARLARERNPERDRGRER